MAAVGAYIFSVAATALLCGMISSLLQGCSIQKTVRFICGMVLMAAVLSPLNSWSRWKDLKIPIASFPEGETLVMGSVRDSQKAMADIIKQNTQTYIMDKAAGLGLEIQAEVILSDDTVPVPQAVTLIGNASPYIRLKLEEILQEELNIAKENLVWTG